MVIPKRSRNIKQNTCLFSLEIEFSHTSSDEDIAVTQKSDFFSTVYNFYIELSREKVVSEQRDLLSEVNGLFLIFSLKFFIIFLVHSVVLIFKRFLLFFS